MKIVITVFCIILVNSIATGQENVKADFGNYTEMREYFGILFQQGKFNEAAAVLEENIDLYTDHFEANAFNLALVYAKTGELQKGIEILRYAHMHDTWFNVFAFEHPIWKPYKELAAFDSILIRNEELHQIAQKSAKSEIEVITPPGYNSEKKYPLFIALHGGGGNNESFRKVWRSRVLDSAFIRAYIQSSEMVSMKGFNWTEEIAIAKKEVSEAFLRIKADYSIDENEIFIGGFSSGGKTALEVTLCNSIPLTGFILLCPQKPESFQDEIITNAANRNIQGVLITTEMDPSLPEQREMSKKMNSLGLEHQFIITPDTGHWFPEHFEEFLDEAIVFVRNQEHFRID